MTFICDLHIGYNERDSAYRVRQHVHQVWQWYMLVHGQVTTTVDGSSFALEAGQAIVIPPGAERSQACRGRAPGYVVAQFACAIDLSEIARRLLPLPSRLQPTVDDLVRELVHPGPHAALHRQVLLERIILAVLRDSRPSLADGQPRWVQEELVALVEAHVQGHLDRPLRREDLARALHMSVPHLARRFRAAAGCPLGVHLTRLRLRRARELLRESSMAITTIAAEVGFSSFSHFTQLFRREVGMTPSEYRRGGGGDWGRRGDGDPSLVDRTMARVHSGPR